MLPSRDALNRLVSAGLSGLALGFAACDSLHFTLAAKKPVLTWSTPAPITYGTALSGTQLNATSDIAGTFVYSPASGTVMAAGAQTLSVTFTPVDSRQSATSTSVTLQVKKATPAITWPTPSPIEYGVPLTDAQLHASSSVQGKFSYSPDVGAVLDGGCQSLSATFTPSDTDNYSAATAAVVLDVKAPSIPFKATRAA